MFTVVGGTYRESCIWPVWDQLYGSGLRGAIVCSGFSHKDEPVKFVTWCSQEEKDELEFRTRTHQIDFACYNRADPIEFQYEYPVARPFQYPDSKYIKQSEEEIEFESGLVYGTIEAKPRVKAKRLVWDPQSGEGTQPDAHLNFLTEEFAIVLNRAEACAMLSISQQNSITSSELAKQLLDNTKSTIVVVKDGPCGSWIVSEDGMQWVPSYKTQDVFSIGSGDVFSATFAWGWLQRKLTPFDAADFASRATAHYCATRILPLPVIENEWINDGPASYREPLLKKKTVYLAGPFFNVPERWFVRQVAEHLRSAGLVVFSPFEDVGLLSSAQNIAKFDLAGLCKSDALFLIADGFDAGSLFEAGYATAEHKNIFVYAERSRPEDLTMLLGTSAKWFTDLASAIYWTAWTLNSHE